MIKIATAFSGGLAACEFTLRYEELDHEVIFACEWDKYARNQYLEFHGEPKTFYNDISDLDARKYKDEIDLFVWGSPCQDLSLAGKRKGFDGEKSSLFREGARVLKEMMPKVFIFENVKGLLSSNGGADYKEVVKTFQDLGYLIASKVVNAKEHGTAQNRERVFIVGFLDEEEYHSFNFADKEPLTKVLRDYLEEDIEDKYYLSDKIIKGFTAHRERHEERGNGFKFEPKDGSEIAVCLSTAGSGRATDNYIKEVQVKSATSKGYETATQNDSINFTHSDSKTRRGRVGKGVAQTLDCSCSQGVIEPSIKVIGNIYESGHNAGDIFSKNGIIGALTCSGTRPSVKNVAPKIIDEYKIRRLTPRECFRLQGIKDEDINLINSDTQSYKIAGNAIEVNTMRSIIRQLYKAEKPKGTLF